MNRISNVVEDFSKEFPSLNLSVDGNRISAKPYLGVGFIVEDSNVSPEAISASLYNLIHMAYGTVNRVFVPDDVRKYLDRVSPRGRNTYLTD